MLMSMRTPEMMVQHVERNTCDFLSNFLDNKKEDLCTTYTQLVVKSEEKAILFKSILLKSGWTVFEKDDGNMTYTLIVSAIDKYRDPKSHRVWTPKSIWKKWGRGNSNKN
jgi:hypothetical protein